MIWNAPEKDWVPMHKTGKRNNKIKVYLVFCRMNINVQIASGHLQTQIHERVASFRKVRLNKQGRRSHCDETTSTHWASTPFLRESLNRVSDEHRNTQAYEVFTNYLTFDHFATLVNAYQKLTISLFFSGISRKMAQCNLVAPATIFMQVKLREEHVTDHDTRPCGSSRQTVNQQ